MAESSLKETLLGWVVLAVLALIVWTILPDSWTDPWKYGWEYNISSSRVHWTDRPTACDFLHAPLGDKGCHFKKTISGYNAKGELVMGEDAPIYGTDAKTGRAIVSYDNRKSWEWLPEGDKSPDPKVFTVEIGWTRVEE